MDKRIEKLAKLIVNYSIKVKPGEKILVDGSTLVEPFIEELYKQILKKGAIPISNLYTKKHHHTILTHSKIKQLHFPKHTLDAAKTADAVIDIENESSELNSICPKKREAYAKLLQPYWDFLIYKRTKLRRLTLLLPTIEEAKHSNMNLKKFEDYLYSCCFVDWPKIRKQFIKINKTFEQGKEVHLIGKNVDLKFSIKGRNSILEDGQENMPGGELYMAPIKNSLEGWIKFEYPALRDGLLMEGIYLKFEKGRIIQSYAEKGNKVLQSLLKTDSGAKYIGEFGVGINPHATKATKTWVDEKITGTIHLAIGQSYEENKGDNNSAVHFDLVKDMKHAKIILDGKIIQENGKWITPRPAPFQIHTLYQQQRTTRILKHQTTHQAS